MKKFFLTIVTIVITAVALSVSFISCNKDSSSNSSGDSLSGTTWRTSTVGMDEVYTLKFNTGDSVSLTWEEGTDKETEYGKYSYDGNSIYIEFEDYSATGTINGNTLVLRDGHGSSLEFTKI